MAKSSDYYLKVKEKELAEKFKQAEREYLKKVKQCQYQDTKG